MAVENQTETVTAAHEVLLNETAPELAVGDIIAITVSSWEGGEREIKGEVIELFQHGRVKLRLVNSAISIDARACRLVMAARIRRAA